MACQRNAILIFSNQNNRSVLLSPRGGIFSNFVELERSIYVLETLEVSLETRRVTQSFM